MNIKFKDVGQGDSILITWQLDGEPKVGIVDCNCYQNRNPLLAELQLLNIKSIDFIFLSHPHYDHYSGLEELLIYCDTNNIIIDKLFHTCSSIGEFLEASVRTPLEDQTLYSLWARIDKLYDKTIRSIVMINEASGATSLNNDWKFVVLAPTYAEQQDFNKLKVTRPEDAYRSNLLSTIIKFYTSDSHILLTSDAENQTFKRILMHKMHLEFGKSRLLLGQVSHHGANANFHEKFWRNQNYDVLTPMAISVGPNHYGHPSEQVISKLHNNNFQVHMTSSSLTTPTSVALGAISTIVSSTGSDLYFCHP